MNIVVGYLPTPEGTAALDHALFLARRDGGRLVVVNTGRRGDNSDPSFASAQDLDAIEAELDDAGVDHEVRQSTTQISAAEAIIETASEIAADLIVIGGGRRRPRGEGFTGSNPPAGMGVAA